MGSVAKRRSFGILSSGPRNGSFRASRRGVWVFLALGCRVWALGSFSAWLGPWSTVWEARKPWSPWVLKEHSDSRVYRN